MPRQKQKAPPVAPGSAPISEVITPRESHGFNARATPAEPRAVFALRPEHRRGFQRRNELARIVALCARDNLDMGPCLGWAHVVANLAAFGFGGLDARTFFDACRRIGLPSGFIDPDVVGSIVTTTAHAAEARGARFRLMSAREAGALIQLTSATREEADCRTLDACDEAAEDRQRRLNREKLARRRLKRGSVPHSRSVRQSQPWAQLGFPNEKTWRRHGCPATPYVPARRGRKPKCVPKVTPHLKREEDGGGSERGHISGPRSPLPGNHVASRSEGRSARGPRAPRAPRPMDAAVIDNEDGPAASIDREPLEGGTPPDRPACIVQSPSCDPSDRTALSRPKESSASSCDSSARATRNSAGAQSTEETFAMKIPTAHTSLAAAPRRSLGDFLGHAARSPIAAPRRIAAPLAGTTRVREAACGLCPIVTRADLAAAA